MYTAFFHLAQSPFSIAPDPRYLFMSERHREALAHLLYGIDAGGGIVLLSGEIGTGKTTLCRCLLEQVPDTCNIAYVFNPKLTVGELLETICAEFHIALPSGERRRGTRAWIDALNRHLLEQHAAGRHSVLVIDEAQNLAPEVLEQLRLLTNLETNERKLLQIILIGQPELRTMLAQPKLEQLAQRVIAHYHLGPLNEQETASYVQHRLTTAGLNGPSPFPPSALRHVHRLSGGVPRRINLLCDRALLGAYAQGAQVAGRGIVAHAASELFVGQRAATAPRWSRFALGAAGAAVVAVAAATVGTQVMDKGALSNAWPTLSTPAPDAWPAQQATASVANEASTTEEPMEPKQVAVDTTNPSEQTIRPAEPDTPAAATFAGISEEADALRELATLWGWSEADGEPCTDKGNRAHSSRAVLRCYSSSGGIAELRQLDRPAVLRLVDGADRPYFALLVGLDDGGARLQAGATQQQVSLSQLTRHFRGEFTTLWRNSAGAGASVTLGQHGAAVDWVGQQLARVHNAELPPARQPYNLEMLRQVRLFQQAQGLSVDGVVGPVTFMHLNRVAGVTEPRLLAAASGD